MTIHNILISHPWFGKKNIKNKCCVCGLNIMSDDAGISRGISWLYDQSRMVCSTSYLNICENCKRKSSKRLLEYLCKRSYYGKKI